MRVWTAEEEWHSLCSLHFAFRGVVFRAPIRLGGRGGGLGGLEDISFFLYCLSGWNARGIVMNDELDSLQSFWLCN